MESFQLLSLSMMLAVGLSYLPFITLKNILSTPTLLRVFFLSHKWMLNLFKCFFQMYWDLLIFILHFNVYHIALQMLNHPGIPKINPSWLWCMFLLMYYWIRLANILLMMFTSPFIRVITLWFSLLVASLSGFGSRIILAS